MLISASKLLDFERFADRGKHLETGLFFLSLTILSSSIASSSLEVFLERKSEKQLKISSASSSSSDLIYAIVS